MSGILDPCRCGHDWSDHRERTVDGPPVVVPCGTCGCRTFREPPPPAPEPTVTVSAAGRVDLTLPLRDRLTEQERADLTLFLDHPEDVGWRKHAKAGQRLAAALDATEGEAGR